MPPRLESAVDRMRGDQLDDGEKFSSPRRSMSYLVGKPGSTRSRDRGSAMTPSARRSFRSRRSRCARPRPPPRRHRGRAAWRGPRPKDRSAAPTIARSHCSEPMTGSRASGRSGESSQERPASRVLPAGARGAPLASARSQTVAGVTLRSRWPPGSCAGSLSRGRPESLLEIYAARATSGSPTDALAAAGLG